MEYCFNKEQEEKIIKKLVSVIKEELKRVNSDSDLISWYHEIISEQFEDVINKEDVKAVKNYFMLNLKGYKKEYVFNDANKVVENAMIGLNDVEFENMVDFICQIQHVYKFFSKDQAQDYYIDELDIFRICKAKRVFDSKQYKQKVIKNVLNNVDEDKKLYLFIFSLVSKFIYYKDIAQNVLFSVVEMTHKKMADPVKIEVYDPVCGDPYDFMY